MTDIHNQSIPEEVLTQATTKVNEAIALLKPYLLSLTPTERFDMLKMGDKSLGFVSKSYEFAKNKPELGPSYFSMDDLRIDLTDFQGLQGLSNMVMQLHNGVEDTMMIAGSEAFYSALQYYSGARGASKQDIQGAKAIYEELKKRFPGRNRSQKDTDTKE